jgi:hypothetical protein
MDEAGDAHDVPRYRRAIIERVSTTHLQAVAIAKRRQLAATLGLFAMLFVAVGAVAATGASTGLVKGFVVVALVIAVLLGLMAWGVMHSVRQELAERQLDAVIEAAVRSQGQSLCSCGHEHDPNEMHYTDGCAHDGKGTDCSHSCDTCVLTALRRPSPRPRPGPGRPAPVRR